MKSLIFFLILGFFITGCAESEHPEEPVMATLEPPISKAESGSDLDDGDPPPNIRKTYYQGYLKLEVLRADDVFDEAVSKAQSLSSTVATQNKTSIVFRVPVEQFNALLLYLKTLGRVVDESVTAIDVTDAYEDREMRKQLLKVRLGKLEAMFRAATSATQRVTLLKEIGVLRERLEVLESHLRELADRATYSRLELEVSEPHLRLSSRRGTHVSAMEWLTYLQPGDERAVRRGKRFEMDLPEGFITVPNSDFFLGATASNASFRAVRLQNNPEGDARFWVETLKHALAHDFNVKEVLSAGRFQVVRTEWNGDRVGYDVAVAVDGDELLLIEAIYPTEFDVQRFSGSVVAALSRFGERS